MKDLKFKVRTVYDRGKDNMNINGYLDYINVPWGGCFTDWFGIILDS